MIAGVQFAAAALNAWFGTTGVLIASAACRFQTPAPDWSLGVSLVAGDKLIAPEAVLPILAALTTNTVTKMVFAITFGYPYALQVVPSVARHRRRMAGRPVSVAMTSCC